MSTCIDISEAKGIRYLHLGTDWIQGAMRIRKPWDLELIYTREMMLPLLLRQRHWPQGYPRRILIIGMGAGSVLKFLYRHCPNSHLTVVEISPAVVAAAQCHFQAPSADKRLKIVTQDAAEFVLSDDSKPYDLVILDGYDEDGRAGVLDTVPFYQALRARLSDQGIVSANLFGRSKGFQATVERIKQAFDQRTLVLSPCQSGNVAAFALAGEPLQINIEDMLALAQPFQETTGLDLTPTIQRWLGNAEGNLALTI